MIGDHSYMAGEGSLERNMIDIDECSLFSQLAKLGKIGAWQLDAQAKKLFWTNEACQIFGVPSDYQPTLDSLYEFYHPEDAASIREVMHRCLEEGEGWDLTLRVYNKKREQRWIRSIGQAEFINGNIVSAFGLIHDITEAKHMADENHKLNGVRCFVNNGTASLTGKNFLENLAENLAAVMQAKCVFIALVNDKSDTASTIVLWVDGEFSDTVSYELAGTPCATVVAGGLCIYQNDVQQLFPGDRMLCSMGVNSYAGTTLYGSRGDLLGIMAVLNDKPIDDEQLIGSVIALFSGRAGSELERLLSGDKVVTAYKQTVQAISNTIEYRDPYTAGHQHRVAELCVAIANELGWDEDRIEGLRLGASIHDIGKIGIPAEILNRPGRLTANELSMIKTHSDIGWEIIKDIDFSWPVGQIVLQHHERLDGSGYPKGLKGNEIIMEARILAVADVVEAINSHRPYRPSKGIDIALKEIEKNKATFYDPAVVEACLNLFKNNKFEWGI